MKRYLFTCFYVVWAIIASANLNVINGNGGWKKIAMNGGENKHSTHMVEPNVVYYFQSSTITIDFGNQPIKDYSVTISSPFTDVDYYVTSSYTTIPLVVDGISDYTIIIETCDGDVFEGTLAASEYSTTVTM